MANTTVIDGFVGQDPKVHAVNGAGGQTNIVTISICHTEVTWKDKVKTEHKTWITIKKWDRDLRYGGRIKKGDLLTVVGKLREEVWNDSEGRERKTLVLMAEDIIKHDRGQGQGGNDRQQDHGGYGDQQGGYGGQQGNRGGQGGYGGQQGGQQGGYGGQQGGGRGGYSQGGNGNRGGNGGNQGGYGGNRAPNRPNDPNVPPGGFSDDDIPF